MTAIQNVKPGTVERILTEYKLSKRWAEPRLIETYTTVLRHMVQDHEISEDEAHDLRHLRDLFGLSDTHVRDIERAVLVPVYREGLATAVADRALTDAEKERLAQVAARLRLSDGLVAEVRKEDLGKVMRAAFDDALADGRLSTEEDAQLESLAEQLDVELKVDDHTRGTLERCRLLWRLDQGELPILEVPIRLQRREVCHAMIPAEHYEMRTVTRRIRYGGPTARIRIMKGVYWRMGDLGVGRVTEDKLHHLDSGTLYVTSKRLLFDGAQKSRSILYRRIINVTPYSDGIGVEKDAGKDQLFKCEGDSTLVYVVVDAALRVHGEG